MDYMLQIYYSFTPLRLVTSRKEPVRLAVEITNNGNASKMASLEVILPKELSFGKARFKRDITERINSLAPREKREFTYELYAQPMYIQPGDKKITLRANELKRINLVEASYERVISLTVSD